MPYFKSQTVTAALLAITGFMGTAQVHAIGASPFLVTRNTPPGVFDGQYIHPNASNDAVEWWWASGIAKPIGHNPPATFQMLFYQGECYPIQVGPRDPKLPEFYIVLNGFFPNGTKFEYTIPASSSTVTSKNQAVTGVWGDVASFKGAPDLSTWTATFTAAKAAGVTGTVVLKSNAHSHFGCNTTDGPYFDSAVKGQTLSPEEQVLFRELGWPTTIPGGQAVVDLSLNGSPLKFTGDGYHDANWSPRPLNEIVTTWFFGSAKIGPYDLSYISVTPVKSTKTLNTGYLSRNGVVLQNQCSLEGTKTDDRSIITPYGLQHDTISGVDVPTGFVIEYILKNGEQFLFNLTSVAGGAQNPDQSIYHRWVGTGTGGKLGGKLGEKEHGSTIFEWLNPGLVPYIPPSK